MTTETKTQFAKRMGVANSYITKLLHADRLVMKDNLVEVEKSLLRIRETSDPNRDDLTLRHARARAAKTDTQPPEMPPKNPPAESSEEKIGNSYAAARAVKEKYAALSMRADYEKQINDLISREDADAAMKFIGATVRSLLDVFPDQVAPLVAPVTDMDECHALLTENCRNVLVGLGKAIERQRAELDGGVI